MYENVFQNSPDLLKRLNSASTEESTVTEVETPVLPTTKSSAPSNGGGSFWERLFEALFGWLFNDDPTPKTEVSAPDPVVTAPEPETEMETVTKKVIFSSDSVHIEEETPEQTGSDPDPIPVAEEPLPGQADPAPVAEEPAPTPDPEPVAENLDPINFPELQELDGAVNPTLAFGLSGVSDWGTGMQFIDLMKMSREWIGHEPGQWGGMNAEELSAGGFLDEDGWLIAIPNGVEKVGTVWAWGDAPDAVTDRMGTYVLTYEGEGELKLGLDAHVLSSEPGKIVFENRDGGTFVLDVLETDPNGTGEYIHDITIVHEQYLDLHEAGALYNPEWLALIEDARQIRFMDWQETNNSTTVSWDERSQPDGLRTDDGIAVEDMVDLANLVGSDPWFNMPHMADDDYIRAFATYVRDNLDPALEVRVEYSNEWWNWNFQQTQWLQQQAETEWGVSDSSAVLSYGAKMATNMAMIWQEVFADEPEGRLVTVLGSQAANPWVSSQVMNAPVWLANEPDAYVQPASVFDEVAITSYFGNSVVSNETNRDALLAAINDPDVDASVLVRDWLLDPEFKSSIPANALLWADHQELVNAEGLALTSYEGGQHVHQFAFLQGITADEEAQITEFMSEFVRSTYMAELYQEAWDYWAAVSDGPFMQFTDVDAPSKWGSWGTYSHLSDETPRSQLLETLNANTDPWWDAEGGTQYQMGEIGGEIQEDGFVAGTIRMDILIGDDGDNVFLPGPGDDHINGTMGIDRVILSGDVADYTVQAEENGYRVAGPDGTKFIVNVQELSFDGDLHFAIEDLATWEDGMEMPAPLNLPTVTLQSQSLESDLMQAIEWSAPTEDESLWDELSAGLDDGDPLDTSVTVVDGVIDPVAEFDFI